MEIFRGDCEAEARRSEKRREKIQQQVVGARESCYVIFNSRTGKMEEVVKRGDFQLPF